MPRKKKDLIENYETLDQNLNDDKNAVESLEESQDNPFTEPFQDDSVPMKELTDSTNQKENEEKSENNRTDLDEENAEAKIDTLVEKVENEIFSENIEEQIKDPSEEFSNADSIENAEEEFLEYAKDLSNEDFIENMNEEATEYAEEFSGEFSEGNPITQTTFRIDPGQTQANIETNLQPMMELRGAKRNQRLLVGRVIGVSRFSSERSVVQIEYKGTTVYIPVTEMFLESPPDHFSKKEAELWRIRRAEQMLGAEIDFIPTEVNGKENLAVGNRRKALIKKQKQYFSRREGGLSPYIETGMVVEGRVILALQNYIVLELFGVEVSLSYSDLYWKWMPSCSEDFHVGDRLDALITGISFHRDIGIQLEASVRELNPDNSRELLDQCVLQSRYIGTVTGMGEKIIFIKLANGVTAFATAITAREYPIVGDTVSFICTAKDEKKGRAIGLISTVIHHTHF